MSETLRAEGMTEIPLYADNPLMMGAWASCLSWAIGEPEIRAAFKEQTGHDLDSIATARGLDKMIDEATGHTRAVMAAWCDWATRNIWGTDEEPSWSPAWQEAWTRKDNNL